MNNSRKLSQTTLKLIATLSMLFDHIGFFLLPEIVFFRVLGRLAFPIFAFFVCEGVRYTRNKSKYLIRMVVLGILCQLPAILYFPSAPLNIFVTFSISIVIIFLFDWLKSVNSGRDKLIAMSVNIIFLILVFVMTRLVSIEYGFAGILFAPLASLPKTEKDTPKDIPYRVFMTIPSFIALAIEYIEIFQFAALLAIPFLLLYSGKRGKYSFKYFFYIFYPLHLSVLYYLSSLIK